MRSFSFFHYLAVLALSATTGAAQVAPTLWDHNGSQVSLSADGAGRQFRYQTPRASLLEIGVQPGALLFDGRRNGDRYSGTAYVFTKVCGARPYAVAGPVSADQRAVTMYGKAPILNSSCRATGYRDDVLVFNISPEAKTNANQSAVVPSTPQQSSERAASQQEHDAEHERFSQQWGTCFDPTQIIAANISGCDSALSFPHVSAADRTHLLERRSTLVDFQRLISQEPMRILPPQGDNGRQSVIPTNWIPLVSIGAVVILFAIFVMPLAWPWLRHLQHRSVAEKNSTAEVASTAATSNQSAKAENVVQLPIIADNPPRSHNDRAPKSMSLKLKRSMRSNVMGKI